MNQCEWISRLGQEPYASSAWESNEWIEHRHQCDECRRWYEGEQLLDRSLTGDLKQPAVPANAVASVMAAIDNPVETGEVLYWKPVLKLAAALVLFAGIVFSLPTEKSPEDGSVENEVVRAIEDNTSGDMVIWMAQIGQDVDLARELERTERDVADAVAFIASRL